MAEAIDLEFETHYGDATAGLDVLLYLSQSHQVAVWTMAFPSRREIVGIEAMPRDGRSTKRLVIEWLIPRVQAFLAAPPEDVVPLPAALIREGVSFRRVMRDLAEVAARGGELDKAFGPFDVGVTSYEGKPLGAVTSGEMRHVESLVDAVIYARAVQTGRSPVDAIAKHRTISPRTAEGRIQRARARNLLSPATGKRAGGQLTPYAEELLGRMGAVQNGLLKLGEGQNG